MSNGSNMALALIEMLLVILPALSLALTLDLQKRTRNKIIKYVFIGAAVGLVICSILELAGIASGAMLILAPLALLFYVVIPFCVLCVAFMLSLPEWDERRRAKKLAKQTGNSTT